MNSMKNRFKINVMGNHSTQFLWLSAYAAIISFLLTASIVFVDIVGKYALAFVGIGYKDHDGENLSGIFYIALVLFSLFWAIAMVRWFGEDLED